ncbi:peroxisomal docking factor component Pex14-Penicillium chrysogenum [Penicillium robsamsonii]|uniref:peroxisomal docking factor component Pex14-Penicillium chrysogenum n=1 Tax=Penicillium robsamsonii TaxID=1792511 RepID=UPI002549C02E|nr:peroxisomal docking factor component Pex14-Penicillium chrysogenum [Penicillium robsamsonii]KAJ5826977.1 peroxisomal docking factor component Pex14-Penicillium chrysogenum [Penicillium robsamsonii]
MAPREELIASAVTFLQDPSVASSPIEKRVSFLQSKNLTQEEVDIALSRVGEDPSAAAAATASASPAPSYSSQPAPYRQPQPPQGYGYPPYNQWQPPPEPPKRDWRDWFIMATVVGGVGYGLYTVTKRYIAPLIAPPTPPQLEQDKENIDEQFSRAFTLIEQLSTDTAALKTAEEARTERLDGALKDVENLVADLKNSSRRRDDETRRISDEVKSLKDAIPKALEGAREGNENRLKELGTELKSLKTLLGNRLGGGGATPVTGRTLGSTPLGSTPVPSTPRPVLEETPATPPAPAPAATNNLAATVTPAEQEPTQASAPASTSQSPNPLSQLGRSASIPAWQMAAANRSKASSQSSAPATPAETTASPSLEQSAPPS